MTKTTLEKLEAAVSDTIVNLGIGGYVPTSEFLKVFPEINATTFAQIMYATDQMLCDFEGAECLNLAHLVPTIQKHDFENKTHFREVAYIFRKHFGTEVARRNPTSQKPD